MKVKLFFNSTLFLNVLFGSPLNLLLQEDVQISIFIKQFQNCHWLVVVVAPNSCIFFPNPDWQLFLFQPFIFVPTNKNMNEAVKMSDMIITCIDWVLAWPLQVTFCIQLATKMSCIICCPNEDCVFGYTLISPLETNCSQCLFVLLVSLSLGLCYLYPSVSFCLSSLGSICSPCLFFLPGFDIQ